jgi:murein DD-endopeptidase MepM/ murein hydrolase activator NlpD
MERKYQLAIALAVAGSVFGVGEALKPTETRAAQPNTPIASVPTRRILLLPTVLPSGTATEFPTLAPTDIASLTPEIPFGEHKCVLPLEPPFVESQGFLHQLADNETHELLFDNNGVPKRHLGVDLTGNLGDTVRAICDGTLIWQGTMQNKEGFGNIVIIRDVKTGYVLLFAHLREFTDKKPGDKIFAGEKIGEVGSVGNSTGPHLHVTVLTPEGWLVWEEGTKNFHGGDFSKSLNQYYANLETVSDEEAVIWLVDPSIYLYQVTGKKIWELSS